MIFEDTKDCPILYELVKILHVMLVKINANQHLDWKPNGMHENLFLSLLIFVGFVVGFSPPPPHSFHKLNKLLRMITGILLRG